VLVSASSNELLPNPEQAYILRLGRIPLERNVKTDIRVKLEILSDCQPHAGLVSLSTSLRLILSS
jgi:hypothetical protein